MCRISDRITVKSTFTETQKNCTLHTTVIFVCYKNVRIREINTNLFFNFNFFIFLSSLLSLFVHTLFLLPFPDNKALIFFSSFSLSFFSVSSAEIRVLKCGFTMSQSEEAPISDTTAPADSALNTLGHHSPDSDPSPNPDASPTPSDLNRAAEETGHDESNLEHQLRDLDLKEEVVAAAAAAETKDDGERKGENDYNEADAGAAGNKDDEEEKNENENDGENGKRFEEVRSHYPVRPDAENCAYYMKTGLCKFGSNCKFNHPVRRKNQVFFLTLL